MSELLKELAYCIERGKATKESPYPPDLKEKDGASEITQQLLENGTPPDDILKLGLMVGMGNIGDKFGRGEAYIPELLIAAKTMNASMDHLKPFFEKGDIQRMGTMILGTVTGDLHDIGKNLVRMVLEGDGWKVVDLGTDVGADKFLKALDENPEANICMSALLTTTMINMESITKDIKSRYPDTKVFIGGAPVTQSFNDSIGSDGYFPDPHSLTNHL